MDPIKQFMEEVDENIRALEEDERQQQLAKEWMIAVSPHKYTHNFKWLGRPIIQFPQDIVAVQNIIWEVKPDLIIETGIAHGGSLIFSASMLAILDQCESIESGQPLRSGGSRKVLGIDIDIRSHNREAIEKHPLSCYIEMIEGPSTDEAIIDRVRERASGFNNILVLLDSNHTHDHVLSELHAYAPLTTTGSYCVVFDTLIEDLPAELFKDRPWQPGDNPKTAVWEFLKDNHDFVMDTSIQHQLSITVAPDGYLKKIR